MTASTAEVSATDISARPHAGRGSIFDYDAWEARLPELAKTYRRENPFPHIFLDQFINSNVADEALAQFPSADSGEWIQYRHVSENKLGQNKRDAIPEIHRSIIDEFNSPRFIRFLERMTGIEGLVPDPHLEGGGLHQIRREGFLNLHADFTAHVHQPLWARRVNLLLYLNRDWQDAYGGHLELWDRQMHGCVQKILPVLNRCVVFNTDPDTFHGHPDPLQCPEGQTRKSMALYYYTIEKEPPARRSTEYRARPQDSAVRAAMIYADKKALRMYDFVKRRFGLDDRLVSRILRRFS
jgi:hypothetical protein